MIASVADELWFKLMPQEYKNNFMRLLYTAMIEGDCSAVEVWKGQEYLKSLG